MKTKASIQFCWKHNQSLHEEVSQLEDMFYEMENGLISSEEETLKLETNLTKINRNMLDFERNLQGVAKQVEAIRKLGRERQVSQSVIKATVEKAILEVGK